MAKAADTAGSSKPETAKSQKKVNDTEGGDSEAEEQQSDSKLSPLGRRTLEGYKKKFGEENGETKFASAMDRGIIDRKKMSNAVGVSK